MTALVPDYRDVTVYHHRAWTEYLLPASLPGARPLEVAIGETADDVLARLAPACTAFVFHVNLTHTQRVPLDRAALIDRLRARGIAVFNARLDDISKPRLYAVCDAAGVASTRTERAGDPDEQVILKTAYNYHGRREAQLTVEQRACLGYASPHDLPGKHATAYRIVLRRDVPDALWTSPHWVVERYITNAMDRFHRVYVAGDAMVVSGVYDPSLFKKMPEGIERESVYTTVGRALEAPEGPADFAAVGALCARVARAGQVEWGALDVVSDDRGGYYVIDINATPHWGDGGHPTLLSYLGGGLVGPRHG